MQHWKTKEFSQKLLQHSPQITLISEKFHQKKTKFETSKQVLLLNLDFGV